MSWLEHLFPNSRCPFLRLHSDAVIAGTASSTYLTITLLEHNTVTVNTRLDDYLELWLQDPDYRWQHGDPQEVSSILNKTAKGSWSQDGPPMARRQARSVPNFHPARGLVEFKHRTNYTYNFYFGRADLDLDPNHDYSVITRRQGCAAWDYGSKAELPNLHRSPSDRCKHSPTVFETVSAVASTIKDIFERERPMPFFMLPLELRDEVYEHLKYAS